MQRDGAAWKQPGITLKKSVHHEELIELLAIPLGDQRTVTKWLVNEGHEEKQAVTPAMPASFWLAGEKQSTP
ncbi:MAG: hypothetical protein Q8O58_07530 [Gallionella sp.]|nr:hypothetical protein [Gallionella sp.]